MAVYSYIAQDRQGNRLAGVYQGVDSAAALRAELEKAGYKLLKASQAQTDSKTGWFRKRVSQKELIWFAYQFAGMYAAGLTVVQCLSTIEQQTENPQLRRIISDIRQQLETGASLKKAFGKYQDLFSPFFVGMVEAGQTGGRFAEALYNSAVYLEKRHELSQKVRSAFVYPAAVGVVCVIVVTGMLLFVVPMFAKMYQRMHVPLPWPTQLLLMFSGLLRGWWIVIAIALAWLIWLTRRLIRVPAVRSKIDELMLRLPVIGRANRLIVVSRFIRTFAGLIGAGVPIMEAIDVAQSVVNNTHIGNVARQIKQSIQTGHTLAASLKAHQIFPALVVQMADSGEHAGALAQMLTKAVDFLDKDIDRLIAGLLVRLEPALTVVMGLLVGLILLAVYMPMFDYMGHLR